jgi:hypothetical protein
MEVFENYNALLTQPPYWDLNNARDNYGLDITHLMEDGVKEWIKDTFINDCGCLRKAYISKDFVTFYYYIKKLKECFG